MIHPRCRRASIGWLLAFGVVVASGVLGLIPRATASNFEVSELVLITSRGRYPFSVEMAVTNRQRSQGLQERRVLAADSGMLFDFGISQPVAMWMKNTWISLDMIFLDSGGRVVKVAENTVPFSLDVIASDGPVLAVLEVVAGTARRLGVKPGAALVKHPLFDAR